jgi:hypothetical protein
LLLAAAPLESRDEEAPVVVVVVVADAPAAPPAVRFPCEASKRALCSSIIRSLMVEIGGHLTGGNEAGSGAFCLMSNTRVAFEVSVGNSTTTDRHYRLLVMTNEMQQVLECLLFPDLVVCFESCCVDLNSPRKVDADVNISDCPPGNPRKHPCVE